MTYMFLIKKLFVIHISTFELIEFEKKSLEIIIVFTLYNSSPFLPGSSGGGLPIRYTFQLILLLFLTKNYMFGH